MIQTSRLRTNNIGEDWEFQFLGAPRLPKIIGLTGPTKSGKTITAKRLATEHGYYYFSMGGLLARITMELGKNPKNWSDLGQTARHLRMLKGEDVLAKIVFRDIQHLAPNHDKFVIDSCLHPSEVGFFRSRCDFILIGIAATYEVRVNNLARWFKLDKTKAIELINLRDNLEQYKINRNDNYSPNIDKCLRMIQDPERIIRVEGEMTAESVHEPLDRLINKLDEHWSFL